MTQYLLSAAAALAVISAALWLGRKRRPDVLPVIYIDKTGRPPAFATDASAWTPVQRLDRLFSRLSRKKYHTILPADLLSGKLPPRPVLLLFRGGYQSFLGDVLPLLEKYGLKAAVTLPVEFIGQYDAWEQEGPWQNLLTKKQISELKDGGRVEFVADTPDGNPLPQDEEQIRWALTESKERLKRLYGLDARAVYLPGRNPTQTLHAAGQEYAVVFNGEKGNNSQPLEGRTLEVLPLARFWILAGLFWRMDRR